MDELSNSLFPAYPHIIRLTEHRMKDDEIDNLPTDHFKLGCRFIDRSSRIEGCASLFMKILNSLLFHLINTVRKKILRFVR